MTEKEKLMYKILGKISDANIPIVFKGALITKRRKIDFISYSRNGMIFIKMCILKTKKGVRQLHTLVLYIFLFIIGVVIGKTIKNYKRIK